MPRELFKPLRRPRDVDELHRELNTRLSEIADGPTYVRDVDARNSYRFSVAEDGALVLEKYDGERWVISTLRQAGS